MSCKPLQWTSCGFFNPSIFSIPCQYFVILCLFIDVFPEYSFCFSEIHFLYNFFFPQFLVFGLLNCGPFLCFWQKIVFWSKEKNFKRRKRTKMKDRRQMTVWHNTIIIISSETSLVVIVPNV